MTAIAMILAAGQGTRLRPYTDHLPKCLIELAGQTLLARQVQVLRNAGVEQIIVITGYQAAQIGALGYATVHNPEFATTNMVATLFCARERMVSTADLLIVYGDVVFEPRVLRALLAEDAPLATTIDRGWQRYWLLRMADPLADAETLKLAPGGNIVEIGKPAACLADIEGQYMGLTKVRADHVERFQRAWADVDPSGSYDGRDKPNMFMTSFFSILLTQGWELKAVPVEHGWLEVDSASDLELYRRLLERRELGEIYHPT
jgi:choline kinase